MMRLFKTSVSLLVSSAMLAGCAGGSGGGIHFPSSYAASDSVCHDQRQLLANTGDTFLNDVVAGAVTGAITGALLSAATGGNIARGAAYGAAAGAITNAYLSSLQQQYGTNPQGMVVRVSDDITAENTKIQQTRVAFVALSDCRRGEAEAIRNQFRAHQITRDQANTALAGVRNKWKEDEAYADKLVNGMSKRGQEFEGAYTSIDPNGAAYLSQPLPPQPQPFTALRNAPIRSAPSSKAAQIGSVGKDETVQVLYASAGWWQIVMPDGQPGYVGANTFTGSHPASGGAAPPPPPPTTQQATATAQPQQQQLATLTRTNRQGRQEFAGAVDQSKTQLAAVTQDVPASGQLSNTMPELVPDNAG